MIINLEKSEYVKLPNEVREITAKDKLALTFKSNSYDIRKLFVTVTDGAKVRRELLEGEGLDITDMCKKSCVIDINVDLIVRGRKRKTWTIESLVVREEDEIFKTMPETAYMRETISTMKKVIVQMDNKINELM